MEDKLAKIFRILLYAIGIAILGIIALVIIFYIVGIFFIASEISGTYS